MVAFAHLLKNSEMTLEQNFPLDHSGSDSCIKLKIVLRVSAEMVCTDNLTFAIQLRGVGGSVWLGQPNLTKI